MLNKRTLLLLLTTASAATSAYARTPVLVLPTDAQAGHFYGDIAGDYARSPGSPLGYLETCDMIAGGDCGNDNTIAPFLVNDKHINEFGGGATVGYVLGSPAAGGQPRMEFGFDFVTGDENAGRSAVLSGDNPFLNGVSKNLLLIGIDGGSIQRCDPASSTPPLCLGGDIHKAFYNNDDYLDVDASIRTKQDEANFAFRYLIDIETSHGVKLTPFVGLVGGTAETRFDAKASWVDPSALSPDGADDTVLASLSEKIKTDYYGAEFGGVVSYDLTAAWKLHGAVQVIMQHQTGKLTGHDCLSREYGGSDPGPVPAACVYDPADPVDEQGFATSVRSKTSHWNPDIALSAGATFAVTKSINVGVTGFASYDTSYRVVNPHGTSSDDNLPMTPAHLVTSNDWTPGAQISVSFEY